MWIAEPRNAAQLRYRTADRWARTQLRSVRTTVRLVAVCLELLRTDVDRKARDGGKIEGRLRIRPLFEEPYPVAYDCQIQDLIDSKNSPPVCYDHKHRSRETDNFQFARNLISRRLCARRHSSNGMPTFC